MLNLGLAHEWPSGQCVGQTHVAMESFIDLYVVAYFTPRFCPGIDLK